MNATKLTLPLFLLLLAPAARAELSASRCSRAGIDGDPCKVQGKDFDGGLCYDKCRTGYDGVGPVCWQSCPDGFTDDGAFCRKDAYIYAKETFGRGAGSALTCAPGEEQAGLLCYPACNAGYEGVGPVCWQSCPSGYTNDGVTCRRDAHIYGNGCKGGCRDGYTNDGCTCRRNAHIFGKGSYTRATRAISSCRAGEEKDGALCYPVCRAGFKGVGPVCWTEKCADGFTDDGAFCRKDSIITAKDTYGRGVGKVPSYDSFTRAPVVSSTPAPFTMLFASDPQYARYSGSCGEDDDTCRRESEQANRNQVDALNRVTQAGNWPMGPGLTRGAGGGILAPQSVVINGDLTEFWHGWQVDKFEELFTETSSLKVPAFFGLGNHDYANNVGDCYGSTADSSHCAKDAVDFIKAMVTCKSVDTFDPYKLQSFDEDSLAYSWNVGSYHFVQLHNYPTYTRSEIDIESALDWLETDLTAASAAGMKIVLNMHDYGHHWMDDSDGKALTETDRRFLAIVKANRVAAVFAGHFHGTSGFYQYVHETQVPVFLSGSAENHTVLLAEFGETYMNVAVIGTAAGTPTFQGTSVNALGTYELETRGGALIVKSPTDVVVQPRPVPLVVEPRMPATAMGAATGVGGMSGAGGVGGLGGTSGAGGAGGAGGGNAATVAAPSDAKTQGAEGGQTAAGCSVGGVGGAGSGSWLLALVVGVGLVVARRRRR